MREHINGLCAAVSNVDAIKATQVRGENTFDDSAAQVPVVIRHPPIPQSLEPESRVNRSRSLQMHWEKDRLIAKNIISGQKSALASEIVSALQEFDAPCAATDAAARLDALADGGLLLRRLVERSLLVVEGSPLWAAEADTGDWKWGDDALAFHFESRRASFGRSPDSDRAVLLELTQNDPPPPIYKDCAGPTVKLAGGGSMQAGELWETLRRRRTSRAFGHGIMPAEDLANLLLWTWGKLREVEVSGIGKLLLKTSPSGGARHPIEVYAAVRNVAEIDPGLYHYSVRRHDLTRIGPPIARDELIAACGEHHWVADSAVVFFMTAIVERTMWKYEHGRAYRILNLDAGHLGQTFTLVGTHMGYACFTTAATDDNLIERLVGVDGIHEFAVYTCVVGFPSRDRNIEEKG